MEDEVIKKQYESDTPEQGYQCPECEKYFDDEYFSKQLREKNTLRCPHCSEWMEIVDSDKKIVNHYINLKNLKKEKNN
ncbi:hypothetical protein [Methanobacterium sp.]|uniref:hypothetical protein n=1 Tax=Methanobacterium sp. TaxID=2164 RepID=UPI002ABA747A|nr:hypothetical protein [Methanobacterium sp.]MDY9922738.1 hypothetical protein [Methanobacterium sp.]